MVSCVVGKLLHVVKTAICICLFDYICKVLTCVTHLFSTVIFTSHDQNPAKQTGVEKKENHQLQLSGRYFINKMWLFQINQILTCDWLPKWARWPSLAAWDYVPGVSCKRSFPKSYIINSLSDKLVQSRRLDIGLIFFFFVSLWTSSPPWFVNMQKKNCSNIQLSWPYTWSINQMSWFNNKFSEVILRKMYGYWYKDY